MMLKAVAWDIDGTLVDSEPLHHRALLAGSASFDVDLSDLPEEEFLGVHMADVWRILRPRMPEGLAEQAWLDTIIRHYVAHRHEARPMPGAVEAVRALSAAGIPQACVSNSSRPIVDANLDALGIAGLMAFSLSFDDVPRGKPDPSPYAEACRRLGLAPREVLAVEDSATGIASARAAGLACAALGFDPGAGVRRIAGPADVRAMLMGGR